ncbi:hypothetical protein HDV01_000714, partial [Terramyces sp. JEL0728]
MPPMPVHTGYLHSNPRSGPPPPPPPPGIGGPPPPPPMTSPASSGPPKISTKKPEMTLQDQLKQKALEKSMKPAVDVESLVKSPDAATPSTPSAPAESSFQDQLKAKLKKRETTGGDAAQSAFAFEKKPVPAPSENNFQDQLKNRLKKRQETQETNGSISDLTSTWKKKDEPASNDPPWKKKEEPASNDPPWKKKDSTPAPNNDPPWKKKTDEPKPEPAWKKKTEPQPESATSPTNVPPWKKQQEASDITLMIDLQKKNTVNQSKTSNVNTNVAKPVAPPSPVKETPKPVPVAQPEPEQEQESITITPDMIVVALADYEGGEENLALVEGQNYVLLNYDMGNGWVIFTNVVLRLYYGWI